MWSSYGRAVLRDALASLPDPALLPEWECLDEPTRAEVVTLWREARRAPRTTPLPLTMCLLQRKRGTR